MNLSYETICVSSFIAGALMGIGVSMFIDWLIPSME